MIPGLSSGGSMSLSQGPTSFGSDTFDFAFDNSGWNTAPQSGGWVVPAALVAVAVVAVVALRG